MNQQSEQPSQSPPGPRRLLRSRDDRILGGVCGGLGRYFDVDPVLFRVGAVVLLVIGGIALLVYPALWLAVPADDGTGKPSGPSPLQRLLGGPEGRIRAGRVVAIVAAVIAAGIGTMALIGGAAWATAAGGGAWVAGVVIALGVAAAAGAIGGRRRSAWLLVPAAMIAAPAGVIAAADVHLDGGFGDRHYRPASASALPADGYKLGAGRLRVDLRGLPLAPGSTTAVPIQVGMGAATVIVPPSVCVQSDTKIGAGYVDVLGDDQGGLDVHRTPDGARGSAPRLRLRAKVGIGALEVIHRPQDSQFDDRYHGPHRSRNSAGDNAACTGAAGA